MTAAPAPGEVLRSAGLIGAREQGSAHGRHSSIQPPVPPTRQRGSQLRYE